MERTLAGDYRSITKVEAFFGNSFIPAAEVQAACSPFLDPNCPIRPNRWNGYEPIRHPVDDQTLTRLMEGGAENCLFRRLGKPRVEFSYNGRRRPAHLGPQPHSDGSLSSRDASVTPHFINILVAWTRNLDLHLAALHRPSPLEMHDLYVSAGASPPMDGSNDLDIIFVGDQPRRYLPDVFWLQVFGPPYVDLIGKERMLSCPGFRVEEVAENNVLIQLTENITDVEEHFGAFQELREAVKQYLGRDLFFDVEKGRKATYRVPEFVMT